MKNIWKILAAMMIVALPFAFASCGSDDEEEKAKTYEYGWTLSNTSLSSGATTQEKTAALNAETELNKRLAAAFTKQGFVVDANKQTFVKAETFDEVAIWDNKAKSAVYAVKGETDYFNIIEVLPTSSNLTIKRGGTTVLDEKLK